METKEKDICGYCGYAKCRCKYDENSELIGETPKPIKNKKENGLIVVRGSTGEEFENRVNKKIEEGYVIVKETFKFNSIMTPDYEGSEYVILMNKRGSKGVIYR